MNFVEGERGDFDKEEQGEEKQEGEEAVKTSKLLFSSPCTSSSSTKYTNFLPEHHNMWPGSFDQSQQDSKTQEPSLNFDKKLELMELSLGNNNETERTSADAVVGARESIEREHMFDKVVTPSDVGKLNRLVIPKQHAERYFPLDSSSNEKGLILNFEDRNGKPWRFRYSYWNSSQSYVMTKGWSRFVKEKRLDAGDIVSFQRGVGESGKHRLFIDWRRRPNAPDPTTFSHLELQNQQHYPQSVRWGRLYSIPQSNLSMQQPQLRHLNYSIHPYQQQQYQNRNHQNHYHQPSTISYGTSAQYYLRPPETLQIGAMHQQAGGSHVPLVIDSVPVVHGKTAGKRLRLFGVNMDCPTQDDGQSSSITMTHGTMGSFSSHLASSSLPPPLQLRAPTSAPMQAEFSKKGKNSLSFDLDL
ncbi:hypothetical protein POPTR_002G181600v4 [Populus trichocarpa]|jgi:hypothetical protein|uniref:TF-B3 domain-containing protein n=3 Tax=Populus trichocarpa TaxID=3694 RepID=U5GT98_POPTR|nr:B3 domain-containing transcription factor NGA1 [Populus trichocarpa]XP_024451856.1 B3 domain-containing transcription factor NGA1 [Populus trichocarpa]XP_024451857.1 B3 domain-containing transcription factor NGA1 [Populus trichocarpa]XP_052306693.1 B3 domain-containing transcription factor NGA1 [Populus trichocarpa]XP_052306694.1 B3 domain-containing transcription factor NGA1 [Populus trichocarpa]XP_052306695.1 B3 domain-containing transcription factor NGA1 [Populus trichocarpa]XP_05230669|eukprot:XP_006386670.1 B3 domain-containing transcription factor NGA1 [Populus trichocarpa]